MSTYLESDAVTAAKKKRQQHESSRPVYTSRWEQELEDSLKALDNREFSYDLSADPLWDSYRKAYTRKGRLAMEDTLGKTTALTGGYGNSYASTAAQQSYNGYMEALTDKIPQLMELAQSRFDAETDRLNERYEMYLEREKADRESFDDAFDRWFQELQMLQQEEEALSKEDYDRFEAQRKWEAEHPEASGGSGSSSGGTSGSSSSGGGSTSGGLPALGTYDNGSVSEENIKKIQAALGVTVDGKWGRESYIAAGHVSADVAWQNYLSEFGPI